MKRMTEGYAHRYVELMGEVRCQKCFHKPSDALINATSCPYTNDTGLNWTQSVRKWCSSLRFRSPIYMEEYTSDTDSDSDDEKTEEIKEPTAEVISKLDASSSIVSLSYSTMEQLRETTTEQE